jgi:hypothetical protein
MRPVTFLFEHASELTRNIANQDFQLSLGCDFGSTLFRNGKAIFCAGLG